MIEGFFELQTKALVEQCIISCKADKTKQAFVIWLLDF